MENAKIAWSDDLALDFHRSRIGAHVHTFFVRRAEEVMTNIETGRAVDAE